MSGRRAEERNSKEKGVEKMSEKELRSDGLTRREFLKGAAIGSIGMAAGLAGMSRFARAQEPVVILNEAPFSGPYAETGRDQSRGTRLALDLHDWKVLGRPIKLIERDTPNPAESVRKAKEVVEKYGAKFIQVGTSSAVALAVMEYAAEAEVICAVHAGSDKITGESCNRFTFRWQIPTYGAVEEVVPRLIEMGLNSFFTITPEYVFGEDLLRNVKRVLEREGKEFLGNAYHPLGALEYSPHITAAMAAKPDCILLLNFGGDTVNCIKQAVGFGVKEVSTLVAVWGGGLTQLRAIGTEYLEGMYFGQQYYHKIDTPENKALVELYLEKYGELPPYMGAAGYDQIHAMLLAIEKAGTTDAEAVIEAWEDMEYKSVVGPARYRKCDHNLEKFYLTLRCKSEKEKEYPDDYAEIIGMSAHLVPCEESLCPLARG